jgi:hypothetical protein
MLQRITIVIWLTYVHLSPLHDEIILYSSLSVAKSSPIPYLSSIWSIRQHHLGSGLGPPNHRQKHELEKLMVN